LYSAAHKNFGTPIGEYICSLRINEAKRLLESTDLPIQKIAYTVGIQDYNYFAKFFKLRVGISPVKYRKEFPFNLHNK
jgi:YesN/AraC family two-component response regulator